MTVIYLTDDCIYHILNYLQNNRSTLFNCLLVNRFWSKVTIPLLYANPFSRLKDVNKSLIINTFLLCLNEEERNYLIKRNNIQKKLNSKLFQRNEIKLIYEYPKYIKKLSKFSIYNSIDHWYRQQIKITFNNNDNIINNNTLNDNMPLFIKATFYHMFLRKSNHIRDLEISLNLLKQDIFDINSIIINDIKISNLIILRLNSCYYKTHEIFYEFLKTILKNCKNLKRLDLIDIDLYYNSNEISSIIKQQNELKEFNFYGFYKLSSNDIFSSLKYQKNSLVSLKFHDINFQHCILQNVIKLHNLKSLEIIYCYGMTLELCQIFEFASFKLKELSIKNIWGSNITSKIIKYLGKYLQRLKIENINVEIMNSIIQYSLELKTLDIYSGCHINLSILPYLKNLKIKNLNIYLNTFIIESFFIKLAENLSNTITKISFVTAVNEISLLKFFTGCYYNNQIINLNSLNFNQKFELKHLEIILNYIKNKNFNLKYLGICGLDKIWNIKELILLNQIKEEGIKLVEFRDNFKECDYQLSDY
ncbi:hypothetical protein C1646_764101 [Rhizophagus diaphanus]|nr:hypothetical protein C1646_764101 [Rhizophagus diaphanus] [Rhizophagus sp. MUCL 43196]